MARLAIVFLLSFAFLWAAHSVLAEETLPGKNSVLVVLIFDESCKVWCQKVRPIMKELKGQYTDKIEVIELDASQPSLKQAETVAKSYGVYGFLRDSADWVPIVGIFSSRKKLLKELVGPKQKEVYVAAIDKALSNN